MLTEEQRKIESSLHNEIRIKKGEIYTDNYPMSIGELMNLYRDGELNIHPEFQRIFRWKDLQKSKLIESILLGIPLPSIFVSQDSNGVWDVVDGVQRLSTIFQFTGILKDENGDEVKPIPLIKTEYLPSLEGKFWNNSADLSNSFDEALRLSFKREKIDIKIIKKESHGELKYELFQRLNTLGSKLSDQEVRNCLLIMINKDFYTWIVKLSKTPDFQNTISISDQFEDEKYDLELVLRFLILVFLDEDKFKKIQDVGQFITDYMKYISEDKSFDKVKYEEIFKSTFELLNDSLGDLAFKRYNLQKNKFEGKFLMGAFELISIGLGKNIHKWNSANLSADEKKEKVSLIIKEIWNNNDFTGSSGSGIPATYRIPRIIPLGTSLFDLNI